VEFVGFRWKKITQNIPKHHLMVGYLFPTKNKDSLGHLGKSRFPNWNGRFGVSSFLMTWFTSRYFLSAIWLIGAQGW